MTRLGDLGLVLSSKQTSLEPLHPRYTRRALRHQGRHAYYLDQLGMVTSDPMSHQRTVRCCVWSANCETTWQAFGQRIVL